MALEKVTLYGLPIVTARRINYARVDPAALFPVSPYLPREVALAPGPSPSWRFPAASVSVVEVDLEPA